MNVYSEENIISKTKDLGEALMELSKLICTRSKKEQKDWFHELDSFFDQIDDYYEIGNGYGITKGTKSNLKKEMDNK